MFVGPSGHEPSLAVTNKCKKSASTIAQINHLYNYFLTKEIINDPDRNQTILGALKMELPFKGATDMYTHCYLNGKPVK